MMKPSLRILFVAAFAASSASSISAETPGFDDLRTGVLHIGEAGADLGATPRWLGTGFLIDQSCLLATAKHVVASAHDPRQLVVRLQQPSNRGKVNTARAQVVLQQANSDLAFLRVTLGTKRCSSAGLHVFPLRSAPVGSDLIGDQVAIVGHPILSNDGKTLDIPVYRQGALSSTEIQLGQWRHMLLLDLVGVPGFSGSPVILQSTGQAIGVVYGPGTLDRAFGFEWATPIVYLDYEMALAAEAQNATKH